MLGQIWAVLNSCCKFRDQKLPRNTGFNLLSVTKAAVDPTYKLRFIRSPANEPPCLSPGPYEFIGFGAMDVAKPYGFIGFGALVSVTWTLQDGPY
jgi:hypothetical protein